MVAYKKGSNLADILVHKKTARALKEPKKLRQDCGKNCAICKKFYEGDTVAGISGPLYHDKTIGCKSYNIVYGIWCDKCKEVVYVGETGDKFYTRAQNHLSSIRTNNPGRIPVSRHFRSGGHSLGDISFIGLERVWGRTQSDRREREIRWMGLTGSYDKEEGENRRLG